MDNTEIYKRCFIIREFEKAVETAFKEGVIQGTSHGCIGQEIIPVLALDKIDKEFDYVTGTHRSHGQVLAYSWAVYRLACEMMGHPDGFNGGLGGSQHIKTDKYITNGITGGMVTVGTGIAMSLKKHNKRGVVISFLGDGGFHEGYMQEALQIAQIFQTPILFICENNMYAMSTNTKTYPLGQIWERVAAMGIKSMSVDYEDLTLLNNVIQDAYRYVAEHRMPYFLEIKAFRLCGHSKSDNMEYMTEAEKSFNIKMDPVIRLRNMISPQEAEEIENKAKQEVMQAFQKAKLLLK